MIEPWMRGPLEGVEPFVQPLLFSFQQAREDLREWTNDLRDEEFWERPFDLGAVGFHIRHIGGSVERLMVYVEQGQLTELQLEDLKQEMNPGASQAELFDQLESRLARAESQARNVAPSDWTEARFVGRKKLPTTVGGLITHIAEHTQRHVGEAIITSKVVRATRRRS